MAAAAAGNGGSGSSSSADEGPTELVAFVAARVPELAPVFAALADASRQVAAKLARAGLEGLYGLADDGGAGPQKGSGDVQKKLDVVANDVFVAALGAAPGVVGLASEEEDDVLACSSDSSSSSSSSGSSGDGSGYVVVFDPLDGSRNLDSSMPTGSIWGVYRAPAGAAGSLPALRAAALQPGHRLVAAGYTLYSSATVLALSVGDGGVHGFTLDPASGGFLLSHRNLRAPPRGQVYSLNDAREGDWPAGLQRYIRSLRRGQGQNPKQYSARYVCCLVADFHRTLVDGGICMNPRSHLRLVYEGNPLAFLAEQAGGAGSDGRRRLLEVDPRELHQRLPVFLGSLEDVAELVATGDVQQLGDKKYAI